MSLELTSVERQFRRSSSPESAEADRPDLTPFLDRIANHEIILLATAIITSGPARELTGSSLRNEFIDRVEDDQIWVPAKNAFRCYMADSVLPAGLLTSPQHDKEDRRKSKFETLNEYPDETLALTGALLKWSQKYPDLSVQKVFGSTESTGIHRSPTTRHKIISYLLGAEKVPSMYDVANGLGFESAEGNDYISTQLGMMQNLELLDIESTMRGYDPRLFIEHARYPNSAAELEKAPPETRAILAALEKYIKTTVTLKDLVEEAIQLAPGIDPVRARTSILQSFVRGNRFSGIRNLDQALPTNNGTRRYTTVRIAESAQQPLADLIREIREAQDPDNLEQYRTDALKILDNPHSFSRLMDKAEVNSAKYAGSKDGAEGLDAKALSVINEMPGRFDIHDLKTEFKEKYGRDLSLTTFRRILNPLVESAILGKYAEPISRQTRSTQVFYERLTSDDVTS